VTHRVFAPAKDMRDTSSDRGNAGKNSLQPVSNSFFDCPWPGRFKQGVIAATRRERLARCEAAHGAAARASLREINCSIPIERNFPDGSPGRPPRASARQQSGACPRSTGVGRRAQYLTCLAADEFCKVRRGGG